MKKKNQLGMNPSTASGRLVKDLLFKFVMIHHPNCCICGEALTRETFSIEHKTPWLDSDDPVGLFFDLNNIDFSHLRCNVSQARKSNRVHDTPEAARQDALRRSRDLRRRTYSPEQRADRYKRTGH